LHKPKWIEGSKSKIKNKYQKYSWTNFLNYSGIKDVKQVFHCLNVYDQSFADRFQKVEKHIWNSFQKTLLDKQLVPSSNSYLSILLIDDILNALKNLGYSNLALYNIFTEKIYYTTITELIKSDEEFPVEFRLLTDDQKILIYQEFEHYETFVYSTDIKLLTDFIEQAQLEGFYAKKKTTFLWSEIELDETKEIIEPNK